MKRFLSNLISVLFIIGFFSFSFLVAIGLFEKTSEAGNVTSELSTLNVYNETIQDKSEVSSTTSPAFLIVHCELSKELQIYTYCICQMYDIDFYLALAIMDKESNFDINAVSATNDYGLMQINSCNHEFLKNNLGITDIMDAKQNIYAGLYILDSLLEKYNSPTLALMAYHLGEYGAENQWNKGVFKTEYTIEVLKQAEVYRTNNSSIY